MFKDYMVRFLAFMYLLGLSMCVLATCINEWRLALWGLIFMACAMWHSEHLD